MEITAAREHHGRHDAIHLDRAPFAFIGNAAALTSSLNHAQKGRGGGVSGTYDGEKNSKRE